MTKEKTTEKMICPKCKTRMYPCYEADGKTLRGWAHGYTPICHNSAFIRVKERNGKKYWK